MKRNKQFLFVAGILAVACAAGCEENKGEKVDCSSDWINCKSNEQCLEVSDPLEEGATTHMCCSIVSDNSCTAPSGQTAFSCRYQDETYMPQTMCHNVDNALEDPGCLAEGCPDGYTCNQTTKKCVENGTNQGCLLTGCATGYTCNEKTLQCEKDETPQQGCSVKGCNEGYTCNEKTDLCEKGSSGDEPQIVSCGELTISDTSNTCEVKGSGSTIIIRGDVLGYEKTWQGGAVAISGNKITYVGCGNDLDLSNATIITCPNAVISPSFINGHEHLTYSNAAPGSWGDERFDHRHDWRKGLHGHKKVPGAQTQNNGVVELRSILGGTTSIFGSGKVSGLTRNIDQETVAGIKSVYQTFPLGDSALDYAKVSTCGDYDYHSSVTNFKEDAACPYGPHIAEGINQAAYNELLCLSGNGIGSGDTAAKDIFKPNTAIIHGTAATPDMIAQMQQNNVKLIWSPRTNISLYGDTAQAPLFDTMGVTVGLGADWIYSGSANMLREFACIDYLNRNHYNNYFSDYQLWLMPTYNNAVAFGLDKALGQLKEGYLADIAVFKTTATKKLHRAVIEAENADVTLVMVDGNMIYGDANIMSKGTELDVCGVAKKVNVNANGGEYNFENLKDSAQYPLFFCGTPTNEPTCIPQRTRPTDTTSQETSLYDGSTSDENDIDGDGVPNAEDNCPSMFNPIRPQYTDRKQADYDGDGLGDICDPYPTCASNDASCPVFDIKDRDADGVPNIKDNCPDTANPDQQDTDGDGLGDACDPCNDAIDADGDGLGDACDACPNEGPNEDGKGCALQLRSINDIRQAYLNDEEVSGLAKVQGVVTAINSKYDGSALSSFFIQDPNKPAGILVYSASDAAKVKIGDFVEVKGSLEVYYSLIEIKPTSVEVKSSGNVITPLSLTAEQTTQATSKDAGKNPYDSVLVTVPGLTVDKYDTTYANGKAYLCYDANDKAAYIDDYVMGTPALDSIVKVGETYDVTGILVYDFSLSKIAPRSADDIFAGFGISSITANAAAAGFGSEIEITITMNGEAEEETIISLECGTATCPDSVKVAAGESSATAKITMAADGDTTVTATYGTSSKSTTISGYNDSLELNVASLKSDKTTVAAGSTIPVTVTLTRPDTSAVVVTLSSSDETVATVPASITIPAEQISGTFDVSIVSTEADKKATISAAVGSADAQTIEFTTFVAANIEYTLDFTDFGGTTSYGDKYSKTYESGITVSGLGMGAPSKDANGFAITGGKEGSQIVIENLNGVGSVKFSYIGWSTSGKLDVIVGDDSQTVTANTDDKGTFEHTYDDDTATAIKLVPQKSSENGKNRFVIKSITWTTNK